MTVSESKSWRRAIVDSTAPQWAACCIRFGLRPKGQPTYRTDLEFAWLLVYSLFAAPHVKRKESGAFALIEVHKLVEPQ